MASARTYHDTQRGHDAFDGRLDLATARKLPCSILVTARRTRRAPNCKASSIDHASDDLAVVVALGASSIVGRPAIGQDALPLPFPVRRPLWVGLSPAVFRITLTPISRRGTNSCALFGVFSVSHGRC
jgi:hypothetical protein